MYIDTRSDLLRSLTLIVTGALASMILWLAYNRIHVTFPIENGTFHRSACFQQKGIDTVFTPSWLLSARLTSKFARPVQSKSNAMLFEKVPWPLRLSFSTTIPCNTLCLWSWGPVLLLYDAAEEELHPGVPTPLHSFGIEGRHGTLTGSVLIEIGNCLPRKEAGSFISSALQTGFPVCQLEKLFLLYGIYCVSVIVYLEMKRIGF